MGLNLFTSFSAHKEQSWLEEGSPTLDEAAETSGLAQRTLAKRKHGSRFTCESDSDQLEPQRQQQNK
eukprot:165904-Amphidinium_carterae.1